MKRIMLLLVCGSFVFSAQSQGVLKKVTTAASSVGIDVNSVANSVMAKLVPALGITNKQKPAVTEAVSGFLTAKSKIMSLQQTAPASYETKKNSLFSSLKSKLTTALLASQVQSFMGLKPKANDAANVLSNLFY